MKVLNLIICTFIAAFFISCESDDLETLDITNQTNLKTKKSANNDSEYWLPAINVTHYFGSRMPTILPKIKDDKLVAVGAYITPDVSYEPPTAIMLDMSIMHNNGWSITLGGSSNLDEIYLLYNRPIPKNVEMIKVEVPFNYLPNYTDNCGITFFKNGTYYITGAGGDRPIYLQVVLGTDRINAYTGFLNTYYSDFFNEGDYAPCSIYGPSILEHNTYPIREPH